jgi:hypothetical protein
MVPHPWRRGIQQSADMLQNRTTSLKLENTKPIRITINLTIMCTTSQRRRCGCIWRFPHLRMGRLRRFRHNRSVLWTYWHRLVPRLPRRRRGRQSEHGRRGGHLGGRQQSIFCVDGHRWTRWPNSVLPPSLLHSHGCCRWGGARDLVGSERGGRKSVHGNGDDRDIGLTPIIQCGMFDALFLHEKV